MPTHQQRSTGGQPRLVQQLRSLVEYDASTHEREHCTHPRQQRSFPRQFGAQHSQVNARVNRIAHRVHISPLHSSARRVRHCVTALAVALLASFTATAVFSLPFSVYLTETLAPSLRPS